MFRLDNVGVLIALFFGFATASCTTAHGQTIGFSVESSVPVHRYVAENCLPPAVVCQPPVVCQPAVVCPPPVVVQPAKVWIPGHYEVTIQQVWVPGAVHQVWVAPVFSTQIGFRGIRFQVCVSPGHWKTIRDAGHYESRRERVWVDGRWC